MKDPSFRITTVETVSLANQLDCTVEPDDLDGALDDAGYVRLDHGLTPGSNIAIMPASHTAGRDPGHRAPAIALMHALTGIVHADGEPHPKRLLLCADTALDLSWTDIVGEEIIRAIAAYARKNDPGNTTIAAEMAEHHGVQSLAERVYAITRDSNVVTDVAFTRAILAGAEIEGWEDALWNAKRPEEPMIRVKRHEAEDFERFGVEPRLAELMAWVKAHPDVTADRFGVYAKALGIDPQDAVKEITTAIEQISIRQIETEKGGPSSSV